MFTVVAILTFLSCDPISLSLHRNRKRLMAGTEMAKCGEIIEVDLEDYADAAEKIVLLQVSSRNHLCFTNWLLESFSGILYFCFAHSCSDLSRKACTNDLLSSFRLIPLACDGSQYNMPVCNGLSWFIG